MPTVNYGVRPLGALLGGFMAEWVGVPTTLVVAGVGGCLGILWLLALTGRPDPARRGPGRGRGGLRPTSGNGRHRPDTLQGQDGPDGGPRRCRVTSPLDVTAIREHFSFPERHRVVTNNAASTQPFTAAVDLYRELAPGYENVHRGQSRASVEMTALFEGACATSPTSSVRRGRSRSRCTAEPPRP